MPIYTICGYYITICSRRQVHIAQSGKHIYTKSCEYFILNVPDLSCIIFVVRNLCERFFRPTYISYGKICLHGVNSGYTLNLHSKLNKKCKNRVVFFSFLHYVKHIMISILQWGGYCANSIH